jgi:large subunit ribosomal protein L30
MPTPLPNSATFHWKKFLMDSINHTIMAKLRITQIRSKIDSTKRQKRTLEALGIKRMNNPVEVEDTPQIKGMIDKVNHLIKVEEIS